MEVRKSWQAHLEKNKLEPKEFLRDVIHLNPFGEELMYKLVIPHFAYIQDAKPYWNDMYQIFTPDGKRWTPGKDEYPSGGTVLSAPLKIEFEGNRVDLLAMPSKEAKLGTAKILIDGKDPLKYPEIYTFKRFGSFNHWFPVLRKIQIGGNPPVEEEWTLTFTKMSPDAKDFEYEVKGSVTGVDGQGSSKEKFVSKSGRITIDPQWFHLDKICKLVKKTPAVGFYIKTKVFPVGLDTWAPKTGQNPAAEDFYTVAEGLTNDKHTLEIIPNGDGPLPLRAVVVYRPSLK